MKRCSLLILALASLAAFSRAQEESPQSGYYSYLGAEILAKHKNEMYPVVSTNKKGVFIGTGKGEKRKPWNVSCMAKPVVSLSNRMVEIVDLKYDFIYLKNSRQEEIAYATIRKQERETEIKIAHLGGRNSISLGELEELETEQEGYEELVSDLILEDRLRSEGHGDSINLRARFTPSQDIRDAYCAVIVGHKSTVDQAPKFSVGIQRLGDLLEDIPQPTKFTVYLGEGDYNEAKVDIFLYAGDGSPIATSLSPQLKQLTLADLEKIKEHAN